MFALLWSTTDTNPLICLGTHPISAFICIKRLRQRITMHCCQTRPATSVLRLRLRMMKQTASGTVHLPPPPPLLYINAWADGVVTPVLTNSTDDADADSKQVQLMNLGLPVISSSELAAVPSFDGAALSSFSAVAYPDAATRAAQRHQVTTGLPHAACSQAPPYTTIQIMRAQQPTRRPTLPHIQNTTSPS